MNETWAIRWKASNGRSGIGSFLFTREKAEEIVCELNAQYPSITHWAVDTSSDKSVFEDVKTDDGKCGRDRKLKGG